MDRDRDTTRRQKMQKLTDYRVKITYTTNYKFSPNTTTTETFMAHTENEANSIASNRAYTYRAWGCINIQTQVIPNTYTLP